MKSGGFGNRLSVVRRPSAAGETTRTLPGTLVPALRDSTGAAASLTANATMVLPVRDGDPASSTPFMPSEAASTEELLRCAESLGIPWKRILLGEIESEQRLRRYLSDIDHDCPLASVLRILSFSSFRSWRTRDRIESLACQARGGSVRSAVRQLRAVFRGLIGKGERDQVAFAQHLWFAYQRVLLLQRVRRTAAKSRGTMAERLAFICSRARCGYDDAAWSILQEDSPRRGDRFEAAVRKVREEGFLIPRAETEARSLAELRRILRSLPLSGRRRRSRRPDHVMSSPQRVPLPFDVA